MTNAAAKKKKKKMMKMRLLGLAGIFPAKDKMNPPRNWIREIRLFFGVSTQLLLFLETFLLLTFLFTDITLFPCLHICGCLVFTDEHLR